LLAGPTPVWNCLQGGEAYGTSRLRETENFIQAHRAFEVVDANRDVDMARYWDSGGRVVWLIKVESS
jgi:hypothetical protein